MSEHSTDCRSPEGIATGLVDSIIFAARVLRRHYRADIPAEALEGLRSDEDVEWLLCRHSRRRGKATASRLLRHLATGPKSTLELRILEGVEHGKGASLAKRLRALEAEGAIKRVGTQRQEGARGRPPLVWALRTHNFP